MGQRRTSRSAPHRHRRRRGRLGRIEGRDAKLAARRPPPARCTSNTPASVARGCAAMLAACMRPMRPQPSTAILNHRFLPEFRNICCDACSVNAFHKVDAITRAGRSTMHGPTVRLTMAQALVRYLCTRRPMIDGERVPLFPGVFAIFGHGNVTCLCEALEAVQDVLPTWRGQNEQSMALAAIGFAKAKRRRQIMVAALLDRAGRHQHGHRRRRARMPTACRSCCSPATSSPAAVPDPVLQQVEHFGNPTITVNDAFKAGDPLLGPHHPSGADHLARCRRRSRRCSIPADCGPAFIGALPGHAGDAFDYPEAFFEPTRPPRSRARGPTATELARRGRRCCKTAKKPLIIAGGGVRYSLRRGRRSRPSPTKHGIPVAETIAGKGRADPRPPGQCRPDRHHRLDLGQRARRPRPTWSSPSARGCRTSPPARGRCSRRTRGSSRINAGALRRDQAPRARGRRRRAETVDGARRRARRLEAPTTRLDRARARPIRRVERAARRATRPDQRRGADLRAGGRRGEPRRPARPTWCSPPRAACPGELCKNWRVKAPGTFDCEFGFSCMGYEIAGGWGAGWPTRTRRPIVHDRRRLLPDDELRHLFDGADRPQADRRASATMAALPSSTGCRTSRACRRFNNLIEDCKIVEHVRRRLRRACRVDGRADARRCESLADLEDAIALGQDDRPHHGHRRSTTDAYRLDAGRRRWDVGVPEVSTRDAVREGARASRSTVRKKQRVGV